VTFRIGTRAKFLNELVTGGREFSNGRRVADCIPKVCGFFYKGEISKVSLD